MRNSLLESSISRGLLAIFFVVAGILHFVFQPAYVRVMPPYLPFPAVLVVISGIAECLGGLGVLVAGLHRWAGFGLLLLCLAVLPANVQMLLDAVGAGKEGWIIALLILRLPLQALLMWWIWRATRSAGRG